MSTEPLELFEPERRRLTGLAYRMLGRLEDAEDVVQEAWIRFSNHDDIASIDKPAAWLTTVTTRLALDRLRSAESRRERYVGPWLADPLLDTASTDCPPDESAILAESLSIGFIAVMERLSPLERAVFLLHEVFAYPLTEVAVIVERSHDATRKVASRARKHVAQERPRFDPEPEHIEILAAKVMAAATSGNMETLSSFLAEDIVHISDGGPNRRAARAPIVGQHRVGRFFIGLGKRFVPGMAFHQVRANGQPALYLTLDDEPYMLHVANWSDGKMVGSFAVLNPDKLQAFHRAWHAQQREPDR